MSRKNKSVFNSSLFQVFAVITIVGLVIWLLSWLGITKVLVESDTSNLIGITQIAWFCDTCPWVLCIIGVIGMVFAVVRFHK